MKLLGIQIDNKLKLNTDIHELCVKVNQKVSAFARLNSYLSPDQAKKICNTIILSNFNYCSLVWLFCSDAANVEINRPHKRCLRVLYQDYDSSFQLLLSSNKCYGSESLSFRGSLLWNTLSDKIKQIPTLAAFKNQIKSWTGDKCTCRLCT